MLSLAKVFLRKVRKKTKSGFTLVELLVVMAIAMVVGTAAVMNFTGGERSNSVSRAGDLVLSKVREVQNKSTTVAEGNGEVPCGYGIHYKDEISFQIFSIEPDASTKCDEINSPTSAVSNRMYASDNSVDLELVQLKKPDIVKFAQEFPDIYFVPPEGLVYFSGERISGASSTITVCERTRCAQNNKRVKVFTGGKIILE